MGNVLMNVQMKPMSDLNEIIPLLDSRMVTHS